jgi:hypothetical protein
MNSTDIVVNANVCLYLGENEYTEEVINHICVLINKNEEAGSYYYYKDRLALYYMISRAYKEGIKGFSQCREKILNSIKLEFPEIFFNAALSAAIMLNFGYHDEDYLSGSLSRITDCRNENGGWSKYPFSAGGEYPEPAALYFGSECLSTAFCLEAVSGILESIKL